MRHRQPQDGRPGRESGRRRLLAAASALVVGRGAGTARGSQERFPDRPIRLIVPFAPGGGTDGPSRLIANRASALAGQQVLVENRGGAGGDVAMLAAIAAPPDGHTLVVGHDGTHVRGPLIRPEMPYDARRSLAPVARLFQSWQALVVHNGVPARTPDELVDHARSRREPLSYGSAGQGVLSHVFGELLSRRAGVELLHVPYRGIGPALQDLAAGRIHFVFASTGGLVTTFQGPDFRILAVSGERRMPALAEVPTMAELGYADLNLTAWFGAFAPSETPPPVVRRLAGIFGAAVGDPEVARTLEEQGSLPAFLEPGPFEDFLRAQDVRWRDIVGRTGLRI
jgi:tripartite-type tricarboxylate transporter receptor subunit TctC